MMILILPDMKLSFMRPWLNRSSFRLNNSRRAGDRAEESR